MEGDSSDDPSRERVGDERGPKRQKGNNSNSLFQPAGNIGGGHASYMEAVFGNPDLSGVIDARLPGDVPSVLDRMRVSKKWRTRRMNHMHRALSEGFIYARNVGDIKKFGDMMDRELYRSVSLKIELPPGDYAYPRLGTVMCVVKKGIPSRRINSMEVSSAELDNSGRADWRFLRGVQRFKMGVTRSKYIRNSQFDKYTGNMAVFKGLEVFPDLVLNGYMPSNLFQPDIGVWPFTCVEKLTMESIETDFRVANGLDEYPTFTFETALSNMPKLETLHLNNFTRKIKREMSVQVFNLPNLKTLHISDGGDVYHLISSIRECPKLNKVVLYTDPDDKMSTGLPLYHRMGKEVGEEMTFRAETKGPHKRLHLAPAADYTLNKALTFDNFRFVKFSQNVTKECLAATFIDCDMLIGLNKMKSVPSKTFIRCKRITMETNIEAFFNSERLVFRECGLGSIGRQWFEIFGQVKSITIDRCTGMGWYKHVPTWYRQKITFTPMPGKSIPPFEMHTEDDPPSDADDVSEAHLTQDNEAVAHYIVDQAPVELNENGFPNIDEMWPVVPDVVDANAFIANDGEIEAQLEADDVQFAIDAVQAALDQPIHAPGAELAMADGIAGEHDNIPIADLEAELLQLEEQLANLEANNAQADAVQDNNVQADVPDAEEPDVPDAEEPDVLDAVQLNVDVDGESDHQSEYGSIIDFNSDNDTPYSENDANHSANANHSVYSISDDDNESIPDSMHSVHSISDDESMPDSTIIDFYDSDDD